MPAARTAGRPSSSAGHTIGLAEARTREATERANNLALRNAELKRDLVDVNELMALLESFVAAARERIWSSSLLEEERRKLLGDLQGIIQGLVDVKNKPIKNVRIR